MKWRFILPLALVLLLLSTTPVSAKGRTLRATVTKSDSSMTIDIELHIGQKEICYEILAEPSDVTASLLYITSGSHVLRLKTSETTGDSGCLGNVDREVVKGISPGDYVWGKHVSGEKFSVKLERRAGK